jgi:hypothetical protein
LPTRIVLVDCGSTDSTLARARDALGGEFLEVTPARSRADALQLPYHGIPGKARALHATLTKVRDLDAKACLILDGGVRTMTPHWVEWLAFRLRLTVLSAASV